jgi:hypothetical protein
MSPKRSKTKKEKKKKQGLKRNKKNIYYLETHKGVLCAHTRAKENNKG